MPEDSQGSLGAHREVAMIASHLDGGSLIYCLGNLCVPSHGPSRCGRGCTTLRASDHVAGVVGGCVQRHAWFS